MKARLWKGPFAGKVMDWDGRHEIVIVGPKPMSRQQKYEWMRSHPDSGYYSSSGPHIRYPQVRAVYRISMLGHGYAGNLYRGPAVHPDGSIFYEFVSKEEY